MEKEYHNVANRPILETFVRLSGHKSKKSDQRLKVNNN